MTGLKRLGLRSKASRSRMQLAAVCILCFAAALLCHPAAGQGGVGHVGKENNFSDVNTTYIISAVDDIYAALENARVANFWRVALALPAYVLTVTEPIRITTRTVLIGSETQNETPTSVLQCGPTGGGLLVLDGPELSVSGVQLQGCTRPGLVATAGSNATITITDSVFTRFTRQLVRKGGGGRRAGPGFVAPSTVMLCVWACTHVLPLSLKLHHNAASASTANPW